MIVVCAYRFCHESKCHLDIIGSKRQFDNLLSKIKHILITDVPQDLAVCNIRVDAVFCLKSICLFDWQMFVEPTAVGYRRKIFKVSKDAFHSNQLDDFLQGKYIPLQDF